MVAGTFRRGVEALDFLDAPVVDDHWHYDLLIMDAKVVYTGGGDRSGMRGKTLYVGTGHGELGHLAVDGLYRA